MRAAVFLPAGGCKGVTKAGQRCNGKNVYENGYCRHHGGEGKSLIERRLTLRIEQERKRQERYNRRFAKKYPEARRLIEELKRKQAAKRAQP